MALSAPTRQTVPLGGSVTVLRARRPDRRTETDDLRMELTALHAERNAIAVQLCALARALEFSVRGERPDVAMYVAGRLDALTKSLGRRGAA